MYKRVNYHDKKYSPNQLPLSSYPFIKQSQQKPPYSLRNSAESDCKAIKNIEDMRQSGNKF